MDQRAGQARGLAEAHYCTKTRRSRQKVRFGLLGIMLRVRMLKGQGLVKRGLRRADQRTVAFGMMRTRWQMAQKFLSEQATKMGAGWVGANYRIRLRIWRGREERGRNENLHGRRQACQASEKSRCMMPAPLLFQE
jgi:hypothetical protein